MTKPNQSFTVLIVDDEPINIQVLASILQPDYKVRFTTRGDKAVKLAMNQNPDIILLDVLMPGMDGYTVCKLLKENETTHNTPIIFVTAIREEQSESIGFALGAVDYITKPISPTIVLARIKTHLALRQAALTIETQNLLLMQERELIESIVLQMRSADHIDGRHLRYLTSSVENTSGDILLSAFTPDNRQMVLLGDFTGHGLSAAIGGPLVASIFQILVGQGVSGTNLLREINNQLHVRLPLGIFMTAIILELDPSRRSAIILNAGMNDAVLIKGNHQLQRIASCLKPLGLNYLFDHMIQSNILDVVTGDKIYIFTDGIVEASSPQYESFGMARLVKFLTDYVVKGAPLARLYEQLNVFCGAENYQDDITLIEITV